jgi:hypothetical protein
MKVSQEESPKVLWCETLGPRQESLVRPVDYTGTGVNQVGGAVYHNGNGRSVASWFRVGGSGSKKNELGDFRGR